MSNDSSSDLITISSNTKENEIKTDENDPKTTEKFSNLNDNNFINSTNEKELNSLVTETKITESNNSNESTEVEGEENSNSDPNPSSSYDPKHVHYEGDVAVYKDPNSGYEYTWNKEKEEWSLRTTTSNYDYEKDTHTYTDSDGTKYFWDKEKSAWFPNIDDDFMAIYQMNYGFVTDENKDEENKEEKQTIAKPPEQLPHLYPGQKRKQPKQPEWFDVDDQHNTNVYVSNLPLDIKEEEFVDFMQKCGLVMRDPSTGKMKVKLYTEKGTDVLKGDALCTYIKKESVDLALSVLDGYNYNGLVIKVERAKFTLKGNYDPNLKPKKKKKDKEKIKKMQEKLLDWRPEKMRGERLKHEKVVIVKNAFESAMFDTDVGLILEIQKDLREECSKLGNVRKVVIFDRHPEGVVQINMKAAEEADEIVKMLNGRWYNKRQLTAETWDGKTKYRIAETDSEINNRLNKWSQFLEKGEEEKAENSNNDKTEILEK